MAKNYKKTIVFDLDGTLSNFEEIDHIIIDLIYGDSKFVMSLDKFLWKINRLEILKNSMWVLKFRLIIYSIFSKKRIKKCLNEYRLEYFMRTYNDLRQNYDSYIYCLKEKYNVRVISNNIFAKGLEYNGMKVFCNTSKIRYLRHLKKRNNIEYVVGNNLLDDILTGKLTSAKAIYLGKNPFVKFFSTKNFTSLDEVTNYLLLKSD